MVELFLEDEFKTLRIHGGPFRDSEAAYLADRAALVPVHDFAVHFILLSSVGLLFICIVI